MKNNIISKVKTLFSTSDGNVMDFFRIREEKGEYGFKGLEMYYYKSLGILNKAVNKRAEKVGEISFYLQQGDKIIKENEILNVLAKPNPSQTSAQFFGLWSKYFDIYGKAYIYIARETVGSKKFELYNLNPKNCVPTFDNLGNFVSVKCNDTVYSASEIIYDAEIDPDDFQKTTSIYQSFANAIGTNIGLEQLLAKTIKSGGKMEGILSFKGNVNAQQMSEFKKKLKEQMEESEGFGNIGYIGGDASFQKTNMTIPELGYDQLENRIIEKVCMATGVPRALLGSFENIKFDNADASINIFLRETIKPLMKRINEKLNEKTEIIPENFELKFVDPVPEDIEAKLKLNENGSKNYYLTPNEMRANVGYDKIEGGDDILLPFTMSYKSDQQIQDDNNKDDKSKKKDFSHPLSNYEFRRKYFTKRILIQDRQENRFSKELKKYLRDQKEELIDEIGGKKRLKGLLDSSFSVKREVDKGIKIFFPLLMEYMIDAGMNANEMAGNDYKFSWNSTLESSLDKRCNFFLNSINETTFDRLKREFSESAEANESRQDLVKRIENTYDEISKGRAKTIARTEIHNAANEGTLEGYKQAGMPIKIWVAVMDEKTRDEHAMMDGEERPINMPFSNGLMFPSEINCRCQI